jgi:hypothetical protein
MTFAGDDMHRYEGDICQFSVQQNNQMTAAALDVLGVVQPRCWLKDAVIVGAFLCCPVQKVQQAASKLALHVFLRWYATCRRFEKLPKALSQKVEELFPVGNTWLQQPYRFTQEQLWVTEPEVMDLWLVRAATTLGIPRGQLGGASSALYVTHSLGWMWAKRWSLEHVSRGEDGGLATINEKHALRFWCVRQLVEVMAGLKADRMDAAVSPSMAQGWCVWKEKMVAAEAGAGGGVEGQGTGVGKDCKQSITSMAGVLAEHERDASIGAMVVRSPAALDAATAAQLHGGRQPAVASSAAFGGVVPAADVSAVGGSRASLKAPAAARALRLCERCGVQGKMLLCSGCKSVRYCSAACQSVHWQQHKVTCQAVAKQRC